MPVTPFHIIAGVAAKSISPKYFSWTVFALANVLIDTEAVYYYFTTGIPQHKYFHTWVGATIIIFICALLGKYLCEFGLRIWNNYFLNEKYHPSLKYFKSGIKINNISAWTGAIIGGYSHIFLDSFVNLDMKPYFPFSNENHLLGIISLRNTYYLCIAFFIVGITIYLISFREKFMTFKKKFKLIITSIILIILITFFALFAWRISVNLPDHVKAYKDSSSSRYLN